MIDSFDAAATSMIAPVALASSSQPYPSISGDSNWTLPNTALAKTIYSTLPRISDLLLMFWV